MPQEALHYFLILLKSCCRVRTLCFIHCIGQAITWYCCNFDSSPAFNCKATQVSGLISNCLVFNNLHLGLARTLGREASCRWRALSVFLECHCDHRGWRRCPLADLVLYTGNVKNDWTAFGFWDGKIWHFYKHSCQLPWLHYSGEISICLHLRK